MNQKKIKTSKIVLLLFVCFPVGIYLMWTQSSWSKKTKTIISVIFAVLTVAGAVLSEARDGTISAWWNEVEMEFSSSEEAFSAIISVSFLVIALVVFISWKVYENKYFNSDSFIEIVNRIKVYVDDCNELNDHIIDLKNAGLIVNRKQLGTAQYTDSSKWKMKRPALQDTTYDAGVYHCSQVVCDGARRDPFKYVCKYFDIEISESSLEKFETVLNDFSAAEEGKKALFNERNNIMNGIQNEIPALIRSFCYQRLQKELGFKTIAIGALQFPKYVFKYISPGGNSSTQCTVTMDFNNLNQFIEYLSDKLEFKNSAAGQRALMTSKLRNEIKTRDGFSCKQCGASIQKEPNLLLEIDHIIPVAKGGLTTRDNLQTLCWRCNRKKGAKT